MTNFKALLVISALLSARVAQAASHGGAPVANDGMSKDAMKKDPMAKDAMGKDAMEK